LSNVMLTAAARPSGPQRFRDADRRDW
jgi:hypothetical protein